MKENISEREKIIMRTMIFHILIFLISTRFQYKA